MWAGEKLLGRSDGLSAVFLPPLKYELGLTAFVALLTPGFSRTDGNTPFYVNCVGSTRKQWNKYFGCSCVGAALEFDYFLWNSIGIVCSVQFDLVGLKGSG